MKPQLIVFISRESVVVDATADRLLVLLEEACFRSRHTQEPGCVHQPVVVVSSVYFFSIFRCQSPKTKAGISELFLLMLERTVKTLM